MLLKSLIWSVRHDNSSMSDKGQHALGWRCFHFYVDETWYSTVSRQCVVSPSRVHRGNCSGVWVPQIQSANWKCVLSLFRGFSVLGLTVAVTPKVASRGQYCNASDVSLCTYLLYCTVDKSKEQNRRNSWLRWRRTYEQTEQIGQGDPRRTQWECEKDFERKTVRHARKDRKSAEQKWDRFGHWTADKWEEPTPPKHEPKEERRKERLTAVMDSF